MKLALCVIAKDEAHVIERCLDSARHLVDYVLVEDTGSSDGTQQIVREWLTREKMPGEVIEEPWRDFAYNRSHVLAEMRKRSQVDYVLMGDADDTFAGQRIERELTADFYSIDIRYNGITYQRPQICSNRKPFKFRGVVHELLYCDEPATNGFIDSFALVVNGGGARSRDPQTHRKDAALLEKALLSCEPDLRPRYQFYLAQSYRDCGEKEKALEAYKIRAGNDGGWIEEKYMSLVWVARLMTQLGHPLTDILAAYREASKAVPTRTEALHGAARTCRLAGLLGEGYQFARRGIGLKEPRGLFIENWIYQWGLLDEYAVCSYWTDRFAESLLASELILATVQLEPETRTRIEKNAQFARSKL